MTAQEVEAFLSREFPQANYDGPTYAIEAVRPQGASARLYYHERHIRPGGTLSGPAMMALADYTAYVALLAELGPVPLAVTTNIAMNFLRKPAPRDMIADCTLIKVGRRLAVAEVGVRSDGAEPLVAHAVITYSVPPDGQG